MRSGCCDWLRSHTENFGYGEWSNLISNQQSADISGIVHQVQCSNLLGKKSPNISCIRINKQSLLQNELFNKRLRLFQTYTLWGSPWRLGVRAVRLISFFEKLFFALVETIKLLIFLITCHWFGNNNVECIEFYRQRFDKM